jgi:hypothetical protein
VIEPKDLNPKQRQTFNMWRRLGLSEQSALLAMQQDGQISVSEEERQARLFRSAFGLSEEGARLAVQGRDGGSAVSEAASGSGSRSVSEALSEMSDNDFGRLLEDEQRRRQSQTHGKKGWPVATIVGGAGGVSALPGGPITAPGAVNLSSGQTGNGASTNVVDRGGSVGPALIKITTTVGASPTVTVAVEGSPDGSDWFAVPFADAATPTTVTVATFAITTATTVRKLVQADVPVRYLRLNYTANNNVTIVSADAWVF